jgi:hypothetical protein
MSEEASLPQPEASVELQLQPVLDAAQEAERAVAAAVDGISALLAKGRDQF